MQNQNHTSIDDKFTMNFGSFDSDNIFNTTHMGNMGVGMKRSAHEAGLDREPMGLSSDDDSDFMKKEGGLNASSSTRENMMHQQTSLEQPQQKQNLLPNGKKTKGRVKIKMEFIDNKLRRYTTFSKRKTGIMKKAYELSTLTGTQVMLLVASETGHVYTFATRKLQPMITSEAGKALIQTCLNSPDPPSSHQYHHHDQRMSATGYEETELTYAVPDDDNTKGCSGGVGPTEDYPLGGSSSPSECSSFPASPAASPPPASLLPMTIGSELQGRDTKAAGGNCNNDPTLTVQLPHGLVITPSQPHTVPGGVVVGSAGGSVVYAAGGGLVYAPPPAPQTAEGGSSAPLLLPLQLQQGCGDGGSSVIAECSDGNNFASPGNNSRHHTNTNTDLVKLINTSNIIRNLTNNDFTISNNSNKTGIININNTGANAGSSSSVQISLGSGNSHSGGVIQGNSNLHGSASVIQGSSSSLLQTTGVVYSSGVRRPGVEAGGGNTGVFCLTGIKTKTSSPPGLHLLTGVGDLSAHMPGRVVQRHLPDTAAKEENELEEDEEEEEGEENDEEECVQQAFPTDLSLNTRDKKS